MSCEICDATICKFCNVLLVCELIHTHLHIYINTDVTNLQQLSFDQIQGALTNFNDKRKLRQK